MKRGVVVEENDDFVTLLTPDGQFLKTRNQKGEYVLGEEVLFFPFLEESEDAATNSVGLFNLQRAKIGVLTAVAIMMIFFSVLPIFSEDKVYAYMTIDINPSFELAVDNQLRVVTLEPMNDDGKKLLEELADWEKEPVNTIVDQIVLESKQAGYIQNGKEIFITTVYAQDRKQTKADLQEEINELRLTYEKEDMMLKAIETDQATRDKAMRQGISTGKYIQLQLKQEIEEPKVEEPEVEKPEVEKQEQAASQPEQIKNDDSAVNEQAEKTKQTLSTDAKKKLEEAQQKLKENSSKVEEPRKPHPNGKEKDDKSNPGHNKLNEIKEKLPEPAKNAVESRQGNGRHDRDDDDQRDR